MGNCGKLEEKGHCRGSSSVPDTTVGVGDFFFVFSGYYAVGVADASAGERLILLK